MATGSTQIEQAPVTLSESQALVERVAASVELRRAARLRTFLLYVCDQTLSHGASVIHEQEIGIAIFQRPLAYDTSIDNIVRVNATELRKRLELYFTREGAAEEIVLEIQRGSYTPVFRRRAVSSTIPQKREEDTYSHKPEQLQPPSVDPMRGTSANLPKPPAAAMLPAPLPVITADDASRLNRFSWWQIPAALLLVVSGYLGWQLHLLGGKIEPWRQQPALRTFWDEFLNSETCTDILLADTSFALAEDMTQRQVSLTDYLDYKYKRLAEEPELTEAQRRDLTMVLERNNGSIADFRAGQEILALDPADPSHLKLKFAREYTADAAKRNSLVLIGSRQSNPWVSLFANKLNFDLAYDAVLRRPYVSNRAARPGESATYPDAGNREAAGIGYAVIAYLPGLSNKARTLIIEGSDSQATEAAGDFVTSEESMRLLEQKLSKGKVPFFEALMRTSQLSGTPLHGEVIAYRTYGDH